MLLLLSWGCATDKKINLLEKRANYKNQSALNEAISAMNSPLLSKRVNGKSDYNIFIHPHNMPNGDRFVGGWISSRVLK